MSEQFLDKKIYTLFEVNKSIQKTLNERYKSALWVKAEMNKLNYYNQSGHCFPEMVEKKDGKVIAQMRCSLWKNDYININNAFLRILKEPLKDGIKILFLAQITFDPTYGLSLHILDIDPGYTLGDLEKEKAETIQKLKSEGIYDQNKTLKLPLLPQRIAIISVESSKGYADFMDVISTNPWNYIFFHLLFPSLLQGEKAVEGIVNQLRRIQKVKQHFDVVVIIRGGGGDIGLSCYNNYQLAREIALFPLPVLTGIGHSTNETVAEMISFSNAITPSKLAEYLIQAFHNFAVPVQKAKEKITEKALRLISQEHEKLISEMKLFSAVTKRFLQEDYSRLKSFKTSLHLHAGITVQKQMVNIGQWSAKLSERSNSLLKEAKNELYYLEKNVNNMNPRNVLKRGYSITKINGKTITNLNQISEGDTINTLLFEGTIISTVKATQTKETP